VRNNNIPEIGIKWISLGSYANLFRERVCESGVGGGIVFGIDRENARINYFGAAAAALRAYLVFNSPTFNICIVNAAHTQPQPSRAVELV